jgi:hypothetical protein
MLSSSLFFSSIACLPCFSSHVFRLAFSSLLVSVGFHHHRILLYWNLNNHLVFIQLPPSTAPRRPWSS